MNITDNERAILKAIATSEYQNADQTDQSIVGSSVWTFSIEYQNSTKEAGLKGRQISGVVSSLAQKGLVGTQDSDPDDCIWLTQAGFDALNTPALTQAGPCVLPEDHAGPCEYGDERYPVGSGLEAK